MAANNIMSNLCECGCGQETGINKNSGTPNRFIRGHTNKGKHPSQKTREKMRAANVGSNNPMYGKTGINAPNYKKSMSDEQKKKISESLKGKMAGTNHPMHGKQHSQKTKDKMSKTRKGNFTGEDSSQWQGGISYEPYCFKFNEQIKEGIRVQYGRKCFMCGMSEIDNGKKLSVHHITYNKNMGCDDNEWELIPLCNSCHSQTNHNREYWEKYLHDKLFT